MLDGRAEPFSIRGIDHAHASQRERTDDALSTIADLGEDPVGDALFSEHVDEAYGAGGSVADYLRASGR